MSRYRCGWGNGPSNPAPGMHRAKQVPETIIHVIDTFLPEMDFFHVRVNHVSGGSPPNQDAWTWYTKWRNVLAENPTNASRIRGIGVDEIIPNQLNLPELQQKMGDVDYWCSSAGIRRPDWVLAVAPGNTSALDYIFNTLSSACPGRVWWFAETYLAAYKTSNNDYGLNECRVMLDRIVSAGQHGRTFYAFNVSHYCPNGEVHNAYYNAYATAPTVRNQAVYDATSVFVQDVVSHGEPFGWGFWTPGYSSELSRSDIDEILVANGG